MLISYKRSQTSIILRVKLRNSSLSTGAGLTGLTGSSTGLVIAIISDNEATTSTFTAAATTIENVTTLGTYATPTGGKCRFRELDATNHKGVYELQFDDGRFAESGAKSVLVSISGATNLAECDFIIPLQDLDPYNATPDANVTRYGGLNGTFSGGKPSVLVQHQVDANITEINGSDQAPLKLSEWLAGFFTGTADSGTTTTLVDAALTQADTDYFKGAWIVFTSGTLLGQARLITGFTPGMVTFSPAVTQAVSTHTYVIVPAALVTTGPVDANVTQVLGEADVPTWLVALQDHSDPTANYVDVKLNAAGETAISDLFDLYSIRARFSKDDAATTDQYTVRWFKNGIRVTGGITSPTVTVTNRTTGAALISAAVMTEIGTTEAFKYDATGAERIIAGEDYVVTFSATIDGGTRVMDEIIGRDTAA